jgi:lipopolysaccharide/colanic/teichoic acid biosynthesis glycosyltransferase
MSKNRSRGARIVKRTLDLVGASAGLVLGAPLLAGVSLAVMVLDGRPILFRHRRPGLHGKPFTMLKFRTMRPLRPGEAPYHTDQVRVTPLGRLLRTTSLDELPELWNVLRGEMSLVGPRPLLMEYLDKYTPREARRHEVPPGITGWAAVNGRHATRFKERLELDVWYVENWSLGLDLEILAMTIAQVLRRSDVVTTQGVEEFGFPLPRPEAPEGRRARASTGTGGQP